MAQNEQMRPVSPAQAPDPASSYDRSDPDREAGLGRMDAPKATPHEHPDAMEQAVTHRQDGTRQLNADGDVNQRAARIPTAGGSAPERSPAGGGTSLPRQQPDHSMKEEEPLGADQRPLDISNPRDQRYPKRDGKGGTP
jgi:hypothetical protein